MTGPEYTAKHFIEDKDLIRKAWLAGKKTVTIRGVELALSKQTRDATWQTGVASKGEQPVQHKQVEEWIIAKPVDKYKFVPVFSVELKNNMRSAKAKVPST
jgi:hypothetical protein